jgi:dimethylamine monooxygenase subunit A
VTGSDPHRPTDPPDWLDELRLQPGPPYLAMNTRSLGADGWLTHDPDHEWRLAEKQRLLHERRSVVVAHLDGSEQAANEVCDLVGAPVGTTTADGDHPLVHAARHVAEDLVIMQRTDAEWIVTAGVVCFPSHWSIDTKIGLPLDLVHSPVAHYERELASRVNAFIDRLQPGQIVRRRNWLIVPTDALHLPAYSVDMRPVEHIADDGSPMHIRSERQTLRRLPTGAVLFTIHVQLAPLVVLHARPDIAARMHDDIAAWDITKRSYLFGDGPIDTPATDRLLAWLARTAGP